MQIIDPERWERREHYRLFSSQQFPYLGVTFRLDVTALHRYCKQHGVSFYYALCWLTIRAMEPIDHFHYRIRGDQILRVDSLIPSFTDLHPGSELFHIVTLPMEPELDEFCRKAAQKSAAQSGLLDQTDEQMEGLIYLSCLPWLDFTGVLNNREGPDDGTPQVIWGKYRREPDGRLTLPYSIDANHRLMDGLHLGKFAENLQTLLEGVEQNPSH